MRVLDENATVAERICFYRLKRNMNGNMLAQLVGLSRYAIMDYENGYAEPPLSDLKNMAVALDIEADKLFDDYYRFLDYPYSDRIRLLRAERELLQRELGAMLGVTRRAVERWEHGKHVVSRETWDKLRALKFL